jgi:alpha-L-fucosidase
MQTTPKSERKSQVMLRRTFIKLTSVAGSGIAASNLLGGFSSLARGAVTAAAPIPASNGLPPLPPLAPIPTLPPLQPAGSVPMGDPAIFPEAKMDFPMVPGPYAPTWDSIGQNYPGKEVSWLRDAKFGIWVCFGPQAAGLSGDWYARRLYMQGQPAYNNHLRDFGHPSEVGYKDLLKDWNPTKLDPDAVVKLYKDIGARFMLVQGVHHDNFDNWNSAYQPWNSVNLGPKRDFLDEWSKAAHKEGMRFGVSFHHEYTWWWWLKSLGSDRTGPKAGVPYDGNLTLADGKGQWWEGLDPRLLYGVDLREYKGFDQDSWCPDQGILTNHQEYAQWYVKRWALRIMDVVRKYDPDFIYTDGNSTQPYTGYKSATGFKCDAMQRVMADYYNHSLSTRGQVDTFSIVKFHPPVNGVVNTFEDNWPADIKTDQPWIGETAYGDWYYAPGFVYDAGALVRHMLECVSRDGCFCVNIAMRPDGSFDDGSLKMLADVGDWMKINGEAIYGSHAWLKYGEGANGRVRQSPTGKINQRQADFKFSPQDFRFTAGKDGSVYAFCLTVPEPGTTLKIASMGTKAQPAVPTVKSVSLLGSTATVDWKQSADGLEINCPAQMPFRIALVFKVAFA